MKKVLKDTLALFLITLISGILLGIVYQVTKGPIAEQNEKTKIAAYNSLFPTLDQYVTVEEEKLQKVQEAVDAGGYGAVVINEVVEAYDASNEYLGMVFTVTDKEGYGGDIKFSLGIDKTGMITGLEILDISETAGLGMKAKETAFRSQFAGIRSEQISYTKSGKTNDNEIDAISSATITTKAVTNGVNAALTAYQTLGGVFDEE